MKKLTYFVALVIVAAAPSFALAQGARSPLGGSEVDSSPLGPGWKPCPRCVDEDKLEIATEKAKDLPFNPRILAGIWGRNGVGLDRRTVPELTAWGAEQQARTVTETVSNGKVVNKDPMLVCDPLGYPRSFTFNWGFEFIQLPDRVLQFFEWGHSHRTIWTDGRPLPVDPEPRWFGYSVGRWEGNTLVVRSNGFDDRAWLTEDRARRRGYPQSLDMTLEERYERTSHVDLVVSLTVTDPKVFTKPWVTTATIKLSPNTELWENYCAPSDEILHHEIIRPGEPLNGTNTAR